jgi:hypothetical protein
VIGAIRKLNPLSVADLSVANIPPQLVAFAVIELGFTDADFYDLLDNQGEPFYNPAAVLWGYIRASGVLGRWDLPAIPELGLPAVRYSRKILGKH